MFLYEIIGRNLFSGTHGGCTQYLGIPFFWKVPTACAGYWHDGREEGRFIHQTVRSGKLIMAVITLNQST